MSEQFDVVIVGSGAGAMPVALTLCRAGLKVCMLEKGAHRKAADFPQDEIISCRRNYFVPYVADEPHVVVRAGGKPQRTFEGWTSHGVGGGTVHMSGFFFRLHPVDLKLRSTLGAVEGSTLEDWPFSYEELVKGYEEAEREVGVSGQAGTNPFEPKRADYPLPPLQAHPVCSLVDGAGKKLGWHPFPTPRAVISQNYDGRTGCVYCRFCGSYGCEADAKSSTLASLLPKALATGNLTLRPMSMAARITVGKDGRANGVEVLDATPGKEKVSSFIGAKTVVVAASAIESARLLLNSPLPGGQKTIANGSGLVGRNLTFSTFSESGGAIPFASHQKRVPDIRSAMPFIQRSLWDHYYDEKAAPEVRKSGMLNVGFMHPNPIFQAERVASRGSELLWGAALKQALKSHFNDALHVEIESFGEYYPTAGTYVTLDPEVKDRFGLPAARIHIEHHARNGLIARRLASAGEQLLKAMDATDVHTRVPHGETSVLQHGTCRAGKDPASSVLNPDCRAHEVDNLWVTDGSFMPTSGSAPTTLTILANSFRVGHKMVEAFRNTPECDGGTLKGLPDHSGM